MYRALYRKWRPKTFSDVVGQAGITAALQNQIIHGKIGHAYLDVYKRQPIIWTKERKLSTAAMWTFHRAAMNRRLKTALLQ